MAFCLPKFAADALIKSLPQDLSELTDLSSKERRAFFEKTVGKENAAETNALFESKLLLKDQQRGMINWVKKLTGMSVDAKRDMISKVERMKEILTPESKQAFLEDLASKKLGFGVSMEEAKTIAELSKKIDETKMEKDSGGDRLPYGRAKVEFHNYINDLKREAEKTTVLQKLKTPVKTVSNVAGQTKAIKASLDDSAVFRQGWKAMITNPAIWGKDAIQSLANIAKSFGNKKVLDEVHAEITSRPTYDAMVKAKLDVGSMEESFPTSLPEKIPLFGRVYKASEVGFTAFLHKLRADIFDKYLTIAEKSGIDITDKTQLQSIGDLVNSLTGRSNLGFFEPTAGVVNNVLFSPRFFKSQVDVLTTPLGFDILGRKVTSFQQKQAAINLTKIIIAQAAIMTIANAIQPKSAETDPRSSDFGKIKVGHTRFDVSGGMSSVITLAARLLTLSSKSSTTGKINKLNSGKFGAQTGMDVVYSFAENKLSPVASVVRDLLKGQTFQGTKPTVSNEAQNLFVPLPIQNPIQTASDPKAANLLLIMIADGLGIGANTYSPVKKK